MRPTGRAVREARGGAIGRVLTASAITLLTGAASAQDAGTAADLAISGAGSRPSTGVPAASFTGTVRLDPLFGVEAPSRGSAAYVTFEPGARAAWHTHPLGQVLIVTQGVGRVQRWDGPVHEIRPGDVVRIPPGVKHWHGAAPTTAMTHIAIQEALDGRNVEWLEKVTDAEYSVAPGTALR